MKRESIADIHEISRWCFLPDQSALDPRALFQFPHVPETDERSESVVWREKCRGSEETHRLGCEHEARRNEKRVIAGKLPAVLYQGFRATTAGSIRAIELQRGHSLIIEHKPEINKPWHAEIIIVPAAGVSVKSFPRTDLNDIRDELGKVFGPLSGHKCNNPNQLGVRPSAGSTNH